MSRSATLLASVPRTGLILEIGPSMSPIAAKRDGWNTKILDHTTKQGLIDKYKGHNNVDVGQIEEVDFVWQEGAISDAIPREFLGKFDAFIASHVIEHVPDLIGFLESASAVLRDDGVVILAIPDKRFIFDYYQPISTTADVLQANAEKRSRHTPANVFQHFGYAVSSEGKIAWGQEPTTSLSFIHAFDDAGAKFETKLNSGDYEDIHAWRLTPASFELIMLELARLGRIDLRIDRSSDVTGCEFYVWLKKGGRKFIQSFSNEHFAMRRNRLLKRCLLETRVQIDWLLAGEPQLITEHLRLLPGSTQNIVQKIEESHSPISESERLPRYVDWAPDSQNSVRAFEGEWSSKVPGLFNTGHANLFDDQRIKEFANRLPLGFQNKRVLELGPLEGGHTHMMTERGATVLAIESNVRAWLRCLVVKNHLKMDKATFLLGDFSKSLADSNSTFDFLLASGVLYHMTDPVEVLQNMCHISTNIGIWTHYFDHEVMRSHEQRNKFEFNPREVITKHGRTVHLYGQKYLHATEWSGFCGGSAPGSNWIRKEDIVGILQDEGFVTDIFLDERQHQNGPSLCVFASKK